MDVQITTIYNTFSAIDLQMHPFRINVQSIIYNPFTMMNNDLQPIYNDEQSFTNHLQRLTMIYNPFTTINNDVPSFRTHLQPLTMMYHHLEPIYHH